MESAIILSYKLLADKIAEKYGLPGGITFCGKEDFLHISSAFHWELSTHALQWLATVNESSKGRTILDELIAGVNAINKEQHRRFSSNFKQSPYLTLPFNIISLN